MKNIKKKVKSFINSKMFISGKPPPRLPRSMLQKAWGVDVQCIDMYIDFDENDCCTIGGNKLGVSITVMLKDGILVAEQSCQIECDISSSALSAGALEYTDCTSAEG